MLKKIIINIILIVLTIFILDFSIGKVLKHFYFKAVGGTNYEITYALEKTKADVLIFGSSRANHHYIPKIIKDSLGLTCYNTGRDGAVLLYQNAVLKSVLKRYVPKIIILDFIGGSDEIKQAYDDLSYLTPYYDKDIDIQKIVNLKGSFEELKLISNIYPYNSEIYNIFRNTVSNKKRSTDNGFKPEVGIWKKNIDTIKSIEPYNDSIIISANNEFLDLAKNSGSKVIVVYSPMYLHYNQKRDLDFMKSLCEEKGIPFLDYTKDTVFLNNRKYFKDPLHLNHEGATLFTNNFINKLKDK
ncbi:SGNH/GDSL hydrolase family protein [Aureibaculum luteum]|uniref:hypothetical protein n=1 Tax=Aureibaculum luteum TaxID=1548456 RepID=UPI001300964A|nr:hypothetical protein [Aureibaculum luteum]